MILQFNTLTKDGSTVRYVGTVQYPSIFAKRYGTLVWYAFFEMVRVRYDGTVRLFCSGTGTMVRVQYGGTLFEFAYKTFYVQRADVNEDSCDRARRAQISRYSQVIMIAS